MEIVSDTSKFKIPSSLIALLVAVAVSAYAQDPAAIQKKLVSEYALTQPTADLTDIVTAGAVLVLQKSNLMMAPISSSNLYQNTYKDGKISQNAIGKSKSIFGKVGRLPGVGLIPGVGAANNANAATGPEPRAYVTGEKMWVTKIEVKAEGKEDGVVLELYTDAIADVRYKASLRIPFAKGATLDQIDKMVAEVFKVQPAEEAEQQQQAPAGGRQAPAGGQPAPAPAVLAADSRGASASRASPATRRQCGASGDRASAAAGG